MSISALVLAKNEQDLIKDCLKQLDFAAEIIVLDQSSTDKTVQKARKYTSKILYSSSADFSINRNILLKAATNKWILYMDCDERLTVENIKEIKKKVQKGKCDAYYFPRKNLILGKWLKHGGWHPDYVPRLFKTEKLDKWQGKVHESPVVKGQFGYMKNPITHLTARSINQMFEKTIKWAKIEAQLAYQGNHSKVNAAKVAKSSLQEFTARYFIKLGFLDGTIGLIESIFQALHKAVTLTYLWELQNNTLGKFNKLKNE